MAELFEKYIFADGYHFKYARGKPAVSGKEFHDYYEIVLFLEGHSELISEKIRLVLSPGTVVFVPKETFHQFHVTDNDSYLRCILGFTESDGVSRLVHDVMSEIMVFPRPSEEILSVFATLRKACDGELSEKEKEILLDSAAKQLLIGRRLEAFEPAEKFTGVSELTQNAITYINENLSGELNLAAVAKTLGVSVSSLAHRFRQELNISVYRYITEKRMSKVRQYIKGGMSLADASKMSGFCDYSGFYRLYKTMYGQSPSTIKNK